ncbi:alpha/beta hydrolase [Sphingomonas sp.]|uniref:alpha/beta hydrolase n=1 Tax=Sphingomonas sp. TaxID=28214 RepID=UPI00286C3614|nr:alpha/beta hydrolase [Sphingomonas sp.]
MAGAGTAAVALALLLGCTPVGLLNGISRIAPSGDAVELAASGVPYGPNPRLKLDVWVPSTRHPGKALPVVLFFYGGGWVAGERGDYGFAGRAFAGQGFVAIVPDYRLVPDVRFPNFIEDGALAVKWARAHAAEFGGDPARITLAGHSAGSYIGAMIALDRHYLVAAGVDPHIIRAAAFLSGPYDFYPFTEQRGRDALGNWPRPSETQPISFVRRDAPPMLLVTGTADTVVRPYNSEHLAAALAKAGATVELKRYIGRSHVDTVKALSPIFRRSNPALADSVAFLKAHSQ